ncbi:LysR family transcriptional regulator [Photobacterium damselae]|uniref:LysR family transcriptional regulator n=1 Tax=Photobacterium damselae TaxID=38293 RepID=A0ABD6X4S1_PHODM|nr:LysR family transcriptional regulator [Photobacterium damselae]OBU42592.1 LysR family transcriptional regulator [Photobacterium damselae]PSU17382.1 LysR family transcriptional regulator [Photobacterium damselae]
MNWDDTQYLLALGREGTLRKAAASLYVDQATVGRRIAVLESHLKCQLFVRSNKGYELTFAGQQAFYEATKIELAVSALVKKVKGFDQQLSGDVVISTTDSVAIDFVTTAVKHIRTIAPDLRIKLDVTTQICDMTKRNVDIAIRNIRPKNSDLIVKRLLKSPMYLYASEDYIGHNRPSKSVSSLDDLDLVVHAPMLEANASTLWGLSMENARIALLADSSLLLRSAIKGGIGVGFLPEFMAKKDNLVSIFPDYHIDTDYELWMVTHTDTINSAKIRLVINILNEIFAKSDC